MVWPSPHTTDADTEIVPLEDTGSSTNWQKIPTRRGVVHNPSRLQAVPRATECGVRQVMPTKLFFVTSAGGQQCRNAKRNKNKPKIEPANTRWRSNYKAVEHTNILYHRFLRSCKASCRLQEFPNPLQQLRLDVVGNGSPASWCDFVDELVHRNLLQPFAANNFLAVFLTGYYCKKNRRFRWGKGKRRLGYATPTTLVLFLVNLYRVVTYRGHSPPYDIQGRLQIYLCRSRCSRTPSLRTT